MSKKPVILQLIKAAPDFLLDPLKERGTVYSRLELESLDEKGKKELLEQVEIAIISGGIKLRANDIASMPNLKMVANYSVGYDGLDLDAVNARGIYASNTPDVLNDDVADTAISLLLNVPRRFVEAQKFIEEGIWTQKPYELTTSICNMKVGIVGLGRIGTEIAHRAKAFKCEIAYFARHKKDVEYQYFDNLKDLATWADTLILALPASKETYHLINDDILKALGHGFLINIARGAIVDTEALINALQSGKLAGAGLDVFENEPHVNMDLQNLPNVVIYPHIGSATVKTRRKMAALVVANIDAYLKGERLLTPIPSTRI